MIWFITVSLTKCTHQVPHTLPPGVMVDVGAFDGMDAVQYAKSGRMVYSFEPGPSKIKTIRKNIATHDNSNHIKLFNMAVSNVTNKMIDFWVFNEGSMQDQIEPTGIPVSQAKKTRVPVSTIDVEIPGEIAFLKIDSQGHEPEIIQGSSDHVLGRKIHFISLEIAPELRKNRMDYFNMFMFLTSNGFKCYNCHSKNKFVSVDMMKNLIHAPGWVDFECRLDSLKI